MSEPTETETKEALDEFFAAMIQIAQVAEEDLEIVLEAPHTTVVRRLDEVTAARKPVLRYRKADGEEKRRIPQDERNSLLLVRKKA